MLNCAGCPFLYLLAYLIHTFNLFYIVSFISTCKSHILEGKCGAVVKLRKVNQEGAGPNLPMMACCFWNFPEMSKKLGFCKEYVWRLSSKLFSTPVWIGPASPDAGVELLRQLFLQCSGLGQMLWVIAELFLIKRMRRSLLSEIKPKLMRHYVGMIDKELWLSLRILRQSWTHYRAASSDSMESERAAYEVLVKKVYKAGPQRL
jgi:hypothetical protein